VALSRGSPEPESGQIVGLCSTQLSVIIELYSALFSLRSNVDISLLEEAFMPTLKNSSRRRCSPEMSTDPQIRSGAGFVKIVMKFVNRTAGSDRRQFGSDGGKNLLHMVGQNR